MLNSVNVQGRLTNEPEYNQQGGVVRFTIACQRSFKNKQTGDYDADFIRCVSFGKRAQFISQYFHKGGRVIVSGRWQTGSYTDKQGNKVYTNDLVVSDTEFDDVQGQQGQQGNVQPSRGLHGNDTTDISDDELPF